MNTLIKVFMSQFLMVFLLGLQTINVAHANILLAMITSLLLGICGFFTYSRIAECRTPYTKVWYNYIFAGPCGITASILLQPYLESIF